MSGEFEGNVQIIKKDNIEIRVLRDKCISVATCVVYGPKTFDLDEKNIAIIKEGDWDTFEKIVSAAEACPVYAIEVYKDGEKVYPRS